MAELSDSKAKLPISDAPAALSEGSPFESSVTSISKQRDIIIAAGNSTANFSQEALPEPAPPGDANAAVATAANAVAPISEAAEAMDDPCLLESQQTVVSKRPLIAVADPVKLYTPAELGSRLEGTMLGHFRLEEFVGGGGMGAVFRAVDTMLGRTVAVKVLSRDSTDEETRRRFQNEAESAARLDHENIARVYYVGSDKGLHYIVFEYIEGVNIRDLVEHKGPLPIEEVINYTLQVAEALEHASKRDVVHRDIKPSNVLVTAGGKAKLVDMGLARLHQLESDSRDITASGVTLGTFDYISPEQARDPRIADVRSDLYSLGCTVYFMLTARPPFPEGTVLQKLLSHSSESPIDPRMLRPELDDGLVAIVHRLLAKQPAQRFQQPSELIGELLLVAERLQLSNITRRGTVWITPAKSSSWELERHLPWLAPILLLLTGAFTVELLSGNPQPADFAWQEPRLIEDSQNPEEGAAMPDTGRPADPPADSADPLEQSTETVTNELETEPTSAGSTHGISDVSAANSKPAGATVTSDRSPKTSPTEVTTQGNTSASPASSNSSAAKTNPTLEPASKPLSAANSVVAATSQATQSAPTPSPSSANPDTAKPLDSPLAKIGSAPISAKSATSKTANEIALAQSKPDSPLSPPPVSGNLAVEEMPTSSQMPDEAAIARPVRIVVGPSDLVVPADTLLVSTLATACLEATTRKVDLIELQFSGAREESPIKIAVEKLTIRAVAGFQPMIVFRPRVDGLVSERHMIDIGGGEIQWQGIHARMELPVVPANGWSLFQLRRVASLNVSDAILTIRNADVAGRSLHDGVAFFKLEPPQRPMDGDGSETDNGEPRPMLLPPHVGLERCLIRGQATVFRGDQATPFRVVCQNSLLVSSERFLDFGGVAERPRIQDGRIDVVLKHVTASLGQGIYRLSTRNDAAHQLELISDCHECILFVTDGSAPLIERRGVTNPNDPDQRLYIRGRDNFYPGSMTLLRIGSSDNNSGSVDFDFERRGDGWYTEESPRFSLMWRSQPAADLPADRHTPADYQLAENQYNPAILSGQKKAGADISQLPQPILEANRPAAAVSTETTTTRTASP